MPNEACVCVYIDVQVQLSKCESFFGATPRDLRVVAEEIGGSWLSFTSCLRLSRPLICKVLVASPDFIEELRRLFAKSKAFTGSESLL